ncbi:MAG: NAD(P)/FAD-dependent oxidoreductase [Nitrospirae bacterium]|nr:NAD(P)/FAD-dependent oxidoreductase [Nitrospirota bacterium]
MNNKAHDSCDILVIGAGPAGSSAALKAAQGGAKVILIEQKKEIGAPVQCAEHIPVQLTTNIGLRDDLLVNEIHFMRTHLPNGEVRETESIGYVIDRDRFDQHLAEKAEAAGAEIRKGCKAEIPLNPPLLNPVRDLSLNGVKGEIGGLKAGEGGLSCVEVIEGGKRYSIEAKIIIGADGPKSTVGKWVGVENKDFVSAKQYIMPLRFEMDYTEVYFRDYIHGGYGWLFPKGDKANVGVGVDIRTKLEPSEILDRFVDDLVRLGKIEKKILNETGGLIPVGGIIGLRKDNVLLCGDAAGQCNPITGAGISNAVLCGGMAGEISAKAVIDDNLDILSEYDEAVEELVAHSINHAVEKRRHLQQHWGKDTLSEALKKCWIAFDGYYGDFSIPSLL